eukprot:9388973-Pyramimonas_sp.AAC.1
MAIETSCARAAQSEGSRLATSTSTSAKIAWSTWAASRSRRTCCTTRRGGGRPVWCAWAVRRSCGVGNVQRRMN